MNKCNLKPCPFCGGEAEIRLTMLNVNDRDDSILEEYRVVCRNCAATTGQRHVGKYRRYKGEFIFVNDAYAEAAAAWNRRAVPAEEGPAPEDVNRAV